MALFRRVPATLSVWMISAAAHAEGIPQMDPTWFPNQVLWLAVSFVLLYLLVSKSIAPSVESVLVTREKAIADAIAEAETAKREAESTRGNFESAGQSARVKAAELVATAHAQSTRDATESLAKLDHDLNRKLDQAHAVVADAVAKAQSSMETATASLAATMAGKLLGGASIGEDKAKAAVQTVKKAS